MVSSMNRLKCYLEDGVSKFRLSTHHFVLTITFRLCLRQSSMYWRINIEHITQTEICIFSLEPLFLRATVSKHASKYRSPFISSMCRSLVSLSFCQYSLTTFSNSFRLLPQIQHLIFSACCILVHPISL